MPTYNEDLLPASTGFKLGKTGQLWDVNAQNVTVGTSLSAKSLNGIAYADQFTGATSGDKINAAVASFGSSIGIVICPSTMASGEGSQVPDNVLLIDFRGTAQSQGLRFNLSAAVTANVRSKMFLQDNYNASTVGLGASNSSATSYVLGYVDRPEATNGTIAAVNGTMSINSQQGNFTGNLIGGEFTGTAAATNGSPRTVAAISGVLGNTTVGGNTSATLMKSVWGQAALNSGSGTVTTAVSGYFEAQTVGAAFGNNLAIWALGQSRFDSTLGVGTAPVATTGVLVNNSALTSTSQYGIQSAPSTNSSGTAEGAAFIGRADLASAFTQALNTGLHVQTPTLNGGTITEWNGIKVETAPAAGTAYALKTVGSAGVSLGGKVAVYNSIATVSNGVAAEYATVDLTSQTAAIGTTTLYSVPSTGAGQYRLSWNAKVTTAAGTSSTLGALTIVYTDPDGVSVTLTAGAQISAGTIATTSTANTTGTVLLGLPALLNCKASTTITYAFGYASNAANAMNYNLHLKLEYLG